MEIRRFGPGHRRPEGPPGTRGVSGQQIHQDARGTITELAFGPYAVVVPHTNPNTTWFVVVSGGGWVQVGEERARVGHGEAVLWPAGEPHGAYTDGTEMRAIVVELSGSDDAWARDVLVVMPGDPILLGAAPPHVDRADGSLAEPPSAPPGEGHDNPSGEPW
jgi:quercetin dioxygenase-like cupin family protein